MKRRQLLKNIALLATVGTVFKTAMVKAAFQTRQKVQQMRQRYLRPPGALAEDDFISRCIRCNQCAEICPNQCIKFFAEENGIESQGTPYITPREKACILCMKCGDACPTGAIQPITRKIEPIVQQVKMGIARVDEQLCLSFQNKSCGVCYRACPLPDIALKVGFMEQPHVQDACVGCGLCERSCIQIPQAIKVIPIHTLASVGQR
ncbi:MAG: ferredoxin-type protein NapG [Phenylobacterium sp.]